MEEIKDKPSIFNEKGVYLYVWGGLLFLIIFYILIVLLNGG